MHKTIKSISYIWLPTTHFITMQLYELWSTILYAYYILKLQLKLAKEKAKEDVLEKTLLENQSVVIDDLTAEVESLRVLYSEFESNISPFIYGEIDVVASQTF